MRDIKSIIIDDELNAIKTLKWEIDHLNSHIQVVESFTQIKKAIDYLTYNAQNIDLVFLDIQMPTMDGFEFLERFTNRTFEVIFVTAYDEYAIKAIKESAVDYILKPVEPDELQMAIKKVFAKNNQITKHDKKITIPFEDKLMFLKPSDIIYCNSDGNYCKIHTHKQSYFISKTLKYVGELLPKSMFFRIHQSYIVNFKNIQAFDRSTNYVLLSNGKELPVSRSKRNDFLQQM